MRFDRPGEAAELYRRQRAPGGIGPLDPARYLRALEHARRLPRYSTPQGRFVDDRGAPAVAPNQAATWTELGPGNIGGRTRSILIDPTSPQTVYAGGVGGGVWKSVDGGASWTSLGDLLPNIAVSTMALDPQNTSVIYAGTGEGWGNADGLRGAGIFKTVDGGATWTSLAATSNNPDFFFVNRLLVSPQDGSRVYAATTTGLFLSLDGGLTWTNSIGSRFTPVPPGCSDVVARSDTKKDYVIAACFSYLLLYDLGSANQWQFAAPIALFGADIQARVSLAIAPSKQSTVYALLSCPAAASGLVGTIDLIGYTCLGDDGEGTLYNALLRSDTGGSVSSWFKVSDYTSPNPINRVLLSNAFAYLCGSGSTGGVHNQGDYDSAIAVDPTNPNTVWVGGVDLFRSDDGGVNFGQASNWVSGTANYVHADQHTIVFHPNYDGIANQTVFVGNDGGIFRTESALGGVGTGDKAPCSSPADKPLITWTSLNHGYGVTQFYFGAPFPDGRTYFGGTQDNGTVLGSDGSGRDGWTTIQSGDGGWVAVDPTNPKTLYAEIPNALTKSVDGGATFRYISLTGSSIDSPPRDDFPFVTPFTMDPANPQRLWIAGSSLWRIDNGGGVWQRVTDVNGGGSIIAVDPANSDHVLFTVGNYYLNDGTNPLVFVPNNSVMVLDNATGPPASFKLGGEGGSQGLDQGLLISSIAFDPSNTKTVWAAASLFNTGAACHLYRSEDGGFNWTPAAGCGAGDSPGGLPDVPTHAVAVDPSNSNRIFVGTDIGLFVTVDRGANWAYEDIGFPHASVVSLSVKAGMLFAFTHGRGAWRVPIVQAP
jgi:hypothetical protein